MAIKNCYIFEYIFKNVQHNCTANTASVAKFMQYGAQVLKSAFCDVTKGMLGLAILTVASAGFFQQVPDKVPVFVCRLRRLCSSQEIY